MRKFLATLGAGAIGLGLVAAPAAAEDAPGIVDTVIAVSGAEGFDDNPNDYDILRDALVATGLVGAVAAAEDITVFAPSDRAFIRTAYELGYEGPSDEAAIFAFLAGALGVTADDPGLLDDVLLYHVSPGSQTRGDIFRADSVSTLLGADIPTQGTRFIDADPDLKNAQIVRHFNIRTGNGIIHTINRVLIPIDA
ncbi:MAG: fasciclin domain-containing protein [Actinomycetota bacterium]